MLIGVLLLASITDLRKSKIPNFITLPGIGAGIIYLIFISRDTAKEHIWICALLLILTFPLFAIRAMGAGDVKLIIMISLFLSPKETILSLLIGFGLAVIYGIIRLLTDGDLKERMIYLKDYLYALSTGIYAEGYIKGEEKKDEKNYNVHLGVWITLGVVISLMIESL